MKMMTIKSARYEQNTKKKSKKLMHAYKRKDEINNNSTCRGLKFWN